MCASVPLGINSRSACFPLHWERKESEGTSTSLGFHDKKSLLGGLKAAIKAVYGDLNLE